MVARPPLVRLPLADPGALAAAAGVAAPDADLRALLDLAPRLIALARLPAPTAAGAVLFGATLRGPQEAVLSATGVGETPRDALAACLGEAAEMLAQMEVPAIAAVAPLRAPPPEAGLSAAELHACVVRGLDPDAPVAWVAAVALPDEAPCLLPAPLALRVAPCAEGAPPLSLGCAAGPDWASARAAAAFELFERAALADGRAASLDLDTAQEAAAALARLRGGAAGPRVALRDVTRPGGPPVMRAVSALGAGSAARATRAAGAVAALREMIAAESDADPSRPRAPLAPPSGAPAPAVSLDAALRACAAAGAPLREARLAAPAPGLRVVKLLGLGLPWRAGAP